MTVYRLKKLLGWPLLIGVLLVAVDAEAGQKKNKSKKKPPADTAAQTETATAAGLAAPSRSVESAHRHLLAYETEQARQALADVGADDAWGAAARGWLLQQENDFEAAAAESRRAAELDPKNPAPLIHLGECLTYGEKAGADQAYAEAEKRARALVQAGGEDLRALVYLGVAQQRQKRFAESATTLERARQLAPEDALVRYHLGATRFYQERWQEAFDQLSAAIERSPGIALAYYYRGLAAGKLDRKDLLFNDLDRFVRMAPEAPEANYARRLLAAFG